MSGIVVVISPHQNWSATETRRHRTLSTIRLSPTSSAHAIQSGRFCIPLAEPQNVIQVGSALLPQDCCRCSTLEVSRFVSGLKVIDATDPRRTERQHLLSVERQINPLPEAVPSFPKEYHRKVLRENAEKLFLAGRTT